MTRFTLVAGILAGGALVTGSGCTSYSSERAQFESHRVTVHAVDTGARARLATLANRGN